MGVKQLQYGFTYLVALLAISVMGLGVAMAGVVWHTAQQRMKEQELLFVGHQFIKAIGTYYQRTPGVGKRYPRTFEALLKDDRFLQPLRHLRQVYTDPMTGKSEWGVIPAADGGIMGVYSLSEEVPVKSGNFSDGDKSLEGKGKYSEWVFVYQPPSVKQ